MLIAKLVPLAVTLLAGVVVFKAGIFTTDFWVNMAENSEGVLENVPIFEQITGGFMVMLWVFVGVEGASIFSERAREKKEAARATTMGFLALVVIYVLLSMVPYGFLSRAQLAELGEPALAFVLAGIVGPWGATLVNLGLIISLLGAWISWTMLPVETLQQLSRRKCLPSLFGKVNARGAPTFSLLVTTICCQVFLLSFLFPDFKLEGMTPYAFAFTLCSSTILITWLLGALYQVKLSIVNDDKRGFVRNLIIGVLASAFQIWMIVSAGLVYILVSFVSYIPAFFLYVNARKADGDKNPITDSTAIFMGIIIAGASASIVLLVTNVIAL